MAFPGSKTFQDLRETGPRDHLPTRTVHGASSAIRPSHPRFTEFRGTLFFLLLFYFTKSCLSLKCTLSISFTYFGIAQTTLPM